jgi:hypothetical protein
MEPTNEQAPPALPEAAGAAEAVHEEQPATPEPAAVVAVPEKEKNVENYPSMYDTIPTTFGAIVLGVGIIAGIQWIVRKIFEREKAEHKALTQFVTSMFALIAGLWVADKLIAGPDTELLLPGESTSVLTFIKDITLMVFSYYFGTKANVPPDEPPAPTSEHEGGV